MLALVGVVAASQSAARPRRTVVSAVVVLPHGDRRLRALSAAAPLEGAVVLKPRDDRALTRFIAEVSDPGSARFESYLRPGAFAREFGPARRTRALVTAALRAAGLRVGRVTSDGLLVPFSGSTRAAEQAFATTFDGVRLPNGDLGRVTTDPVSLPSDLAGSVAAVIGLDETAAPQRIGGPAARSQHRRQTRSTRTTKDHPADETAPATSPGAANPCPDAQAAAKTYGGLTDDQIADAYGASGLYAAGDTGAGQHIALYELEPFLRSDIKTFDTCYFGTAGSARMLRRLHVIGVDGGQPYGPGSGEASLDVEDLSALAPGADIDVYVGPSPNPNPNDYDALDEYAAIVDADRDRVVSTSWGLCEQSVEHGQPGLQEAENLLFQQAAAQGQTIFAAAGDNGSDDCDTNDTATPAPGQNPLSVDDPGSQPYVVSVGGLAIDDASSTPALEQVWNDGGTTGAGGGGISMSWAMPAWQRATLVPGIARPGGSVYRTANRVERAAGYAPGFCAAHVAGATPQTPCRLVPDVSAQADELTGAITVYSHEYANKKDPTGWTTTGGTSSATPIWAASLALVNASPACASRSATRAGVGFVSPLLYDVASSPAEYAASFDDVQQGNNDVYGLADGRVFAARPGFDLASGLGSPELAGPGGTAGLATDLCDAAAPVRRPTVLGVAPRTAPTHGGERLTITGRGFALHGAAEVAAVQIGSVRIPADRLQVRGARTISLTLPPARVTLPPLATAAQDGSGSATVVVILRGGATSAPGPRTRFTYLDGSGAHLVPTVGALYPTGGPVRGGRAVTILGSGFDRATAVTFGGVRAARFRIDDADRITVTPPGRTAGTRCAALPHTGVYADDTTTDDVCQVQVRVRDRAGTSAPARIRAPLQGAVVADAEGDLVPPAGCHCEVAPAADEFDYLPRPRITSVSTSRGPASLASEHGGTVITVHGSGLDPLALDWADFGDPRRYASASEAYVFLSGTEMQIEAPGRRLTAGPAAVAFSVRTLAGQSAPHPVVYAGEPRISHVVNASDPRNLDGLYGGPDTGRTPLVVSGRGLGAQVIGLRFVGTKDPSLSSATQYTFHSHGTTQLTAQTVAQTPAVVAVRPCTVTGCSPAGAHNLFWLYPPGAPQVQALEPGDGPAAGGTATTIVGENLGCAIAVHFGATLATGLDPLKDHLPCGSTETLAATSPAGVAGASVPVTVQTAESFYTGTAPVSTSRFSYR